MSGYVVDVRLAVKWLVSEAFSEAAARLLDGKTTLIAPELIFVETANALRAMCLRSNIASADFGFATSTSQLARVGPKPPLRYHRDGTSQVGLTHGLSLIHI